MSAQIHAQAIAGSDDGQTCIITTSGGLQCLGINNSGQLGDGTTTTRSNFVDVVGLTSGVSKVAVSNVHTCAVTTAGAALCWGRNSYGEVGNGAFEAAVLVPVQVNGLSSGVSDISLGVDAFGEGHSCALLTTGGIKCWGNNNRRQLGDNTAIDKATPVNVTGLTSGVASISAGSEYTCAVTTSGGAKCWGRNNYGQIGDGTTTTRGAPVDVIGLTSGVNSIAAGYIGTCSLLGNGGVKCWGEIYGVTPTDIAGFGGSITSISSGSQSMCALLTNGKVECLGYVTFGDPYYWLYTTAPYEIPGMVNVAHLRLPTSAGASFTNWTPLVITSAGIVQRGPVAVDKHYGIEVQGSAGPGQEIDAASDISCLVTTAGAIECWGNGIWGQLGDGTTWPRNTLGTVTGLSSGGSKVSIGNQHNCAVKVSGGVQCWGSNTNGRLGDGTTTDSNLPVDVVGITDAIDVGAGYQHSCALTSAAAVKCWGNNGSGRLGDGSLTTSYVPVDVAGLTSGVQAISVGYEHTCALRTATGGVQCWGRNNNGQLGDGTTTSSSLAKDVIGLTSGVVDIAGKWGHTCALLTSGSLQCWGNNTYGQLGNGTTTSSSTPVAVLGLKGEVVAVSVNTAHTCAVIIDGSAQCWGYNLNGQLGNGSSSNSSVAVDVMLPSTGISKIATGFQHTCAVRTDGTVWCWGNGGNGALGETPAMRSYYQPRSLQGTVTLGGNPLAGVTLTASDFNTPDYPHPSTASDGSGAYSLSANDTLPYKLTPYLFGYSFTPSEAVGILNSDVIHDFTATLNSYSITGTINASGSPLAGATIDAGALGSTLSAASGNYTIAGIDHGTAYTLSVTHPGATFATSTASGTLTSNTTHDFAGTLTTHTLSGTITSGGSPLAGVAVNGGALGIATTNGSGIYSFPGVNYGTSYTLTPGLANYVFNPESSGSSVTGDAAHDFSATYHQPTTISTTSVATTSLATTSAPLSTTSDSTTSVLFTTTSTATSTATTTAPLATTTTVVASTTPTSTAITTSLSPVDSDGDGVTDADEIATGTNPTDPGSKAAKLRTTVCSDWNGYLAGASGGEMYNIMEHVNLTTKKLRVKTELRNIRGHLKDTYEFFLRGNQQFDLLVHDMSGREANSYGQVCTTYERAPEGSIDGRMVYYKFGNKSEIQFAFALPFENPNHGSSSLLINTNQPSLAAQDADNLVTNWVQLSNVSRKRLKGTLTFYSLLGAKLGSYNVNLRDGARYDYSGHSWGRQAGLARFVPEDATVDYQLRAIRYMYDNPSGLDSFTTAYPFSAAVGSGETLTAPVDTVAASGLTTSAFLELSNTLDKKVAVSLKLYDNTGKKLLYSKTHSLKAYSSMHLPIDALLINSTGPNSTGLLTAKSSHAGSIIGSVVHYGRTENGGVKNMYAATLREPVGAAFKGSYNTYLNQGCALYLGNASTSKEKVTISLRQSDGTSPVENYSLTVPGRGLLVEDVCAKSPKNVYGAVTVTATKAKRITGLIVRAGENGRYKMATELR